MTLFANAVPVPMTEEQKFFFDLRGWILLPSVLYPEEIAATKAEVYAGARQSYEGALQNLLDHPAITGRGTWALGGTGNMRTRRITGRCDLGRGALVGRGFSCGNLNPTLRLLTVGSG